MRKLKFYFAFILLFNITKGALIAQHTPQLWSLTQNGGATGSGALFHYIPSTDIQTLDYSWLNDTPGRIPVYSDLTDGGNGKFYGVTSQGGAFGKGVIFEWTVSSNVYTKKFDFNSSDGSNPYGSLTLLDGKLYGMTQSGGANGKGVIFEWDINTNQYSKKIDFSTADGGEPFGALTIYNGKFYGMTSNYGANSMGVIFEWDVATNTYTKKIDFSGTDGSTPSGSLIISNGKFYGMTRLGGANNKGVIFEWDPSLNSYSKKVDLNQTDGSSPYGSLTLFNGKIYGLTEQGGTSDQGVIFEWDIANNIYSKKIDFTGSNGSNPFGSLTLMGGKFYGMTQTGSSSLLPGIIFEWDPSTNDFSKKFNFTGDGAYPQGSLTQAGGKFYGTTANGSNLNRSGVIFEWDPSANIYTKKIDFDRTPTGGYPTGSLSYSKGKFYGVTFQGGANGTGVIFEWNPYSNSYTKKIDFIESTGHRPSGSLTLYNGKFYGITTSGGGVNNAGVIFEWDAATNIYTSKFTLNRTEGGNSYGSLTLYDGKFYGVTVNGGANDDGVIFEWDPSTNIYQKKIDFENLSRGRYPYGSLTLLDGKFYGMAQEGGVNGQGVIFEWDPSSNNFVKKFDFDGTQNGRSPFGSLSIFGGKLYGMTYYGSVSPSAGIIFEWNPTSNNFVKKIDFDITSKGSFPSGSLFLFGDKFYGMTTNGGVNDYGVIFEWDPVSNAFSKKLDFNSANGANPQYSQFIEVPANQAPVLSNLPNLEKECVAVTGNKTFTATDADMDILTFTKTSSNETLLPASNIIITNSGNNEYKVSYSMIENLTGTTVVMITANDGYDGEASFSFDLAATPKKPTITVNLSDPTNAVLTSSSEDGNQWYLDETMIPDAIEKTLIVKDKGIYKTKVSIDGCISPISDGQILIITGDIHHELHSTSQLYPNPAHDFVTVRLNGFKEFDDVNVLLVDGLGQTIVRQIGKGGQESNIDIRNFANGFYYIVMSQGSLNQQLRFIKNK